MLARTGGRFSRFKVPRRRFGYAAVGTVRIDIVPCCKNFNTEVSGGLLRQVLVAEIARKSSETIWRLRGC